MKTIAKTLWVIPLLLAVLSISGCSSHLTYEECLSRDWYAEGMRDGRNGNQRSLKSEILDCKRYGVTVNMHRYNAGWDIGVREYCTPSTAKALGAAGKPCPDFCPRDIEASFKSSWDEGIRSYCTPEVGYELGRAGKSFPKVCPAELNAAFKHAYDKGAKFYEKKTDVNDRLTKLKDKISGKQAELNYYKSNNDNDKVKKLKHEIQSLDRKKRTMEEKAYLHDVAR